MLSIILVAKKRSFHWPATLGRWHCRSIVNILTWRGIIAIYHEINLWRNDHISVGLLTCCKTEQSYGIFCAPIVLFWLYWERYWPQLQSWYFLKACDVSYSSIIGSFLKSFQTLDKTCVYSFWLWCSDTYLQQQVLFYSQGSKNINEDDTGTSQQYKAICVHRWSHVRPERERPESISLPIPSLLIWLGTLPKMGFDQWPILTITYHNNCFQDTHASVSIRYQQCL